MRKWGIVMFVFYALILMALVLPGFVFFSNLPTGRGEFWQTMFESYQTWLAWTPLGILLTGQALLLFLSVDTSFKRLKPRAHIFVSCSVVAFFMALLTFVAIWTLGYTAKGDKFADTYGTILMASCAALWWLWGSLFFLYLRDSSTAITRLVSWLFKGSVLELPSPSPATSSSAAVTTAPLPSLPASASSLGSPSCSSLSVPASSSSTKNASMPTRHAPPPSHARWFASDNSSIAMKGVNLQAGV